MSLFKLLVAAAAVAQRVCADEINVLVGGSSLTFSHPSIPAAVGDTVVFRFSGPGPQNHSVIQGTYSQPCYPLPDGFYSGFMPLPPGAQGGQFLFVINITHTDPIYYYCGQTGHCQAGMVGVINAPSNGSDSFLDYQSKARSATSVGPLPPSITGGEIVPAFTATSSETGSSGSTSTITSSSTYTDSTTTTAFTSSASSTRASTGSLTTQSSTAGASQTSRTNSTSSSTTTSARTVPTSGVTSVYTGLQSWGRAIGLFQPLVSGILLISFIAAAIILV
ncbi:hypothetical protein QBC43DRAFT_325765 [Cladorrhinum sp. PSN259]|nr:hypothetical protein QBC43DRAFT_325765 [Cladorrhinum sp. PSN259]